MPSTMRLSSNTVVFSFASKKIVVFLRLIMRNTSIVKGGTDPKPEGGRKWRGGSRAGTLKLS